MGKQNHTYEIRIVAGGMDQNEPTNFAHVKQNVYLQRSFSSDLALGNIFILKGS
jgi:hypothetical protein